MRQDNCGGVAIIDEYPAVLDALSFLLELMGHRVTTCSSAADFLEDRDAGPIRDLHIPRMTGLELAARLRMAGA